MGFRRCKWGMLVVHMGIFAYAFGDHFCSLACARAFASDPSRYV